MKNRLLYRFTFLVGSSVLLLLAGCGDDDPKVHNRSAFVLGTYLTMNCYDSDLPKNQVETAFDEALKVIGQLETLANPHLETSQINRLNAAVNRERRIPLTAPLPDLLTQATIIANKTDGNFDFTLWPVFSLWHFGGEKAAVPDSGAIKQALAQVDYRRVKAAGDTILLPPGTAIDFGGIHKGYAIELARAVLKKHHLKNFIIDAGGNLGIEWQRSDPVQVQLRHPRRDGDHWGSFPVNRSCGIATSGDYHYYFEAAGRRYHHILDPRSGYPAGEVVSVSVLAPTATEADGLSTAIFVMGREKGMAFIEKTAGIEGNMIYQSGSNLLSEASSGLAPAFRKYNLADSADVQ